VELERGQEEVEKEEEETRHDTTGDVVKLQELASRLLISWV